MKSHTSQCAEGAGSIFFKVLHFTLNKQLSEVLPFVRKECKSGANGSHMFPCVQHEHVHEW